MRRITHSAYSRLLQSGRRCGSCMQRLAFALLLLLTAAEGRAALSQYTEEHPLVIVIDWDFRPFEFQNSFGQPSGYNVEVLDIILDRLDIPHRYVMQDWNEATKVFERREAHLIHAIADFYRRQPFVMTKKFVNYYHICVARRIDTPPLGRIALLDSTDVITAKLNDYATKRLMEMDGRKFGIELLSPKEGLSAVFSGRNKYFVWGEIPLLRKIQELRLDSIVLDEIDIPAGELRLISYDRELTDRIDDQYARLEQSGDLQRIKDKWFHPERLHDDASPLTLLLLAALLAVSLAALVLGNIIRRRVKTAVRRRSDLNSMMEQAVTMGQYDVLQYDVAVGRATNVYGRLLPDGGMTIDEVKNRLTVDDRQKLDTVISDMAAGREDKKRLMLTWNSAPAGNEPQWHTYVGNASAEHERGRLRYIVVAVRDVSADIEEDRANEKLANRYMKVFETNLTAMSLYGTDGRLIDMNRQMRALCGLTPEQEAFFRQVPFYETSLMKGIYAPGSHEFIHVCHRMLYPEIGIDKYVELLISPAFDDNGSLAYYIITARDITAEREIYIQQREHDRKLQTTMAATARYDEQLRYLLSESKMFVWRFSVNDRTIQFTRSLSHPEFTESIDEYFHGMAKADRPSALHNYKECILKGKPFHVVHEFNRTPLNNSRTWYSISGMPVTAADGTTAGHYFGLVRDITDLMSAQQRLREETARAEDSGRMKAAFLANMTHEIRTPLNAIVGFSDLLQMVDSTDERMEFIRIIRNNCDMLLRLINDILEASDMGQSMAIDPRPVDLVRVFDDICQTLRQRVQEPGVEFQKDNPYSECSAVMDAGRLQQLLTNFVTNAVKYTHEGHIRLGYRLALRSEIGADGLADDAADHSPQQTAADMGVYFYCEDTGAGIPDDKRSAVFERFVKLNDFVQGTGLGLSICKSIVERMDGRIGVNSKVGCGSTFWIWLPRELHVVNS